MLQNDHQKACTRISRRVMVNVVALRFYRNSKVAIQVVSTRRESDESFGAASLFVVTMFLISNKKLKRKQVLFQKFLRFG